GRFAIGRPWNEMSDTQKDAYLSAFTDYVAKIYTSRFSDYKGETLEFAGSRSGKKDLYVLTNFARSGQQPLEVSWRVREIGGAPKILDIEAEGISLLVSLKNEMSGLLSQNNNSVDKVIEVLKTKA
ncbi:MAG: ABC transporter substrate-binding protein, partial [Pseudomonadota bacterium]